MVSVLWSSSDPEVASADGSGRVTAIGAGQAAIVARAAAIEASVTVTVPPPAGMVSAEGGAVEAAQGKVQLAVPSNSVTSEVQISVAEAESGSLPPGSDLVDGTAYEFGPDGLQFAEPATLTIEFDDSARSESVQRRLRLHKVVGDSWALVDQGRVDVDLNTVAGEITSFSVYGVLPIPNLPPEVEIEAPENGSSFDLREVIEFAGTGADPEDGALSGESLVWISSLDGQMGTGGSLSRSDLSEGQHVIELIGTDSEGLSDNVQVTIEVVDPPPTVTIDEPEGGATVEVGDEVTFVGSAFDVIDGQLTGEALLWTSDRDGDLGTGESVTTSSLSLGDHVVTLTATNSRGLAGTETISLTIAENAPPAVVIEDPDPGDTFALGEAVQLIGSANDSEDGVLSGNSLVWTSDRDGSLGSGASRTVSDLSEGEHLITLTATDSDGATGSASVTISIVNPPPAVVILSPASGSVFNQNTPVDFEGSATDPVDGPITPESLTWTSNLDGQIGTGESFQRSDLSLGFHSITLTAVDKDGEAGSATAFVTIQNPGPTVEITAPADGTSVKEGDEVTFTGSGEDPDDGTLTGASLVWTSNLHSQPIGTSATVTTSSLALGVHLITLTGTDSQGATGTDEITVTVNETGAPAVEITSPRESQFFRGQPIDFAGTAVDEEDGTLSGSALVWTSDIDGQLGTGASVTRDDLSLGVHTVTLTATDSDGKMGSASIQVEVLNRPPEVVIDSPTEGAVFQLDESIQFAGSGTDPEDGALGGEALQWTSSIDGTLGEGASFQRDDLSAGTHTITLTATDADGGSSDTTVRIRVNVPPAVSIQSPGNGSEYRFGDEIDFAGTATDPEDGELGGGQLLWTSSLNGELGTGTGFTRSELTQGTHEIVLTASDLDGASASTSVSIAIEPPASGPVAVNLGQTEASERAVLESLTLPLIVDPTSSENLDVASLDVEITWDPARLEFVSAEAGDFGSVTINSDEAGSGLLRANLFNATGTADVFTALSVTLSALLVEGPSTIDVEVLAAGDEDGRDIGSFMVERDHTVTVVNSPPVVTITAPADGSEFEAGATVQFEGLADDLEEGSLSGGALVWTSDLDGEIGTGVSVSTSSLSVGNHTITLTAEDGVGAVGESSVQVTIVEPEPEIVVRVGSESESNTSTGSNVVLPIEVDLSNADGADVASVTFTLSWDVTRLSFVSASPGGFGSVTINETDAASGTVQVSIFNATGTTSSFTAITLTLQAQSVAGPATVAISVTAIGDELGQDLSAMTTTVGHVVTIGN